MAMAERSELLRRALGSTLAGTTGQASGDAFSRPDISFYEGKVRDCYSAAGKRWIVTTDRISAFDHVLGTIPFKGQVLTRMAAYWFETTRDIAPNHLLRVADPNVLECVDCKPLLVEMVVRGYLTGTTSTSIWTHYAKGARMFAGHALADGLVKNQRLGQAIVTPATKAPKGQHDVTVARADILAEGHVSAAEFDRAASYALALFAHGQQVALERGLLLVDTKYEFGVAKDGSILVIDEMHTPDSSRYWRADTYAEKMAAGLDPDALDKDVVRRHLLEGGYQGDGPPPPLSEDIRVRAAEKYIAAYEQITGTHFEPDLREPHARIKEAVERSLQRESES